MNKTLKGRTAEKQCEKQLISEGYTLTWKTIRSKWQNIDYFGLFDVIGRKGKNTIYVQVKTVGKHSSSPNIRTIEQTKGSKGISISDFVQYHRNEYESVEVWIFYNARMRGRGKNRKYEKPRLERIKIEKCLHR
ncbi:MAG: hypothetical protein ACOYWZ_00110 [Bacillota bacterium]